MKTARTILVLTLSFWLAGCVLRGNQQTAKNTPPPPLPAAKPEPAPVRAPLSIPQTQVELPPPQPIDPEALEAAQPPGEPAEPVVTLPARTPAGGRRAPAGPPPVPAPRTEPAATPPPAAAATPAAPESSPRIQEIVPANEQKRLQELADGRRRESRQLLDQAAGRRLNRHQTSVVKTIESFLKASEQAEAKGDMRQAADLADRALTLAKDLQSAR
jgi:hypothetical protein